MAEQTAIIREVGYGMRDCSHPVLWFSVYISENTASLQIFDQPAADSIIKDAEAHDVHNLEGKPCWVEAQGDTIKFVRMWKPRR